MSRDGATRSRVTSRILLNKWQQQKERDYQHWLEDQTYQHRLEEERHKREQAEIHWNCPFFRHCWNKGLKLPTRHDCPECSNQYREYRQSQTNRRSIHAQDEHHHNNTDRHLKIEVLLIGLGSELLIKIMLIMKKKVMRKSIFGRKDNGV